MLDIKELLILAIKREASDLHLRVGVPPAIRVHGELIFLEKEPLREEEVEAMIFSLLSPAQKEILLNNKELDFSFEFREQARFRVNVYYQRGTLAAAFRLIPLVVKKIDELGLPKICHQIAKMRQGFVLVTGPTGHGKSTTLAAIIDEIAQTRSCHIVTIEDPIEFIFESKKSLISQRELGLDTYSWNVALRAVFREDPDVILVGEMRDYDTMSAALTLAETGHLVLSTLHTNSASQTITRIIDTFPEEAKNQVSIQLSTCLEVVISQRLVPRILGGRTVVCEVMVANSAIKTVIRENKVHMIDNIIQTSGEEGMITLDNALAELVDKGEISLETATLFAERANDLKKLLKI